MYTKYMSSSKISNICSIERLTRNAYTGNTAACINIQYKGIHWLHVLYKILRFTIHTSPVTKNKKRHLIPYPNTPTQPLSHYTVLSSQFPAQTQRQNHEKWTKTGLPTHTFELHWKRTQSFTSCFHTYYISRHVL